MAPSNEQEEQYAKDIGSAIAEMQFVSNTVKKDLLSFVELIDKRIEDGVEMYSKLDALERRIAEKMTRMDKVSGSRLIPEDTYADLTLLMKMVSEKLGSKKELASAPKKPSEAVISIQKSLDSLQNAIKALSEQKATCTVESASIPNSISKTWVLAVVTLSFCDSLPKPLT